MKRIVFKGLPPNDNVIYEGKILKNGAIVEMKDSEADVYIELKWAFEVDSENEAVKFQEQQTRVNKTRKKIEESEVK